MHGPSCRIVAAPYRGCDCDRPRGFLSDWLILDMKKPRGLPAILASLPPIDWEGILIERQNRWGKGSKHRRETLEHIKKVLAARRKAIETEKLRRRNARLKERSRARRAKHYPAVTLQERILAAMQPGQWYGRPDLRELTGISYNNLKWRVATMQRGGLLERARNPAAPAPGVEGYNRARASVYRKGLGVQWQAKQEPEFLFRLTDRGEELRLVALALV